MGFGREFVLLIHAYFNRPLAVPSNLKVSSKTVHNLKQWSALNTIEIAVVHRVQGYFRTAEHLKVYRVQPRCVYHGNRPGHFANFRARFHWQSSIPIHTLRVPTKNRQSTSHIRTGTELFEEEMNCDFRCASTARSFESHQTFRSSECHIESKAIPGSVRAP